MIKSSKIVRLSAKRQVMLPNLSILERLKLGCGTGSYLFYAEQSTALRES